jgi:glycine cleavage system regulatory protein
VPPGATPSLLIVSHGKHKAGATAAISQFFFEKGASIMGSKKVVLEGHFSMMTSLYLPPSGISPAEFKDLLGSPTGLPHAVRGIKGLDLVYEAQLLETTPDVEARTKEMRKLVLECPQKPGLVLAFTSLLKDNKCSIFDLDASTSLGNDGAIWFRLECLVEVPEGCDAEEIKDHLVYLEQANSARLTFDKWQMRSLINPLSGA